MTELFTIVAKWGPQAGAIVVVFAFLYYLSEDRKDRAKERTAQYSEREQFLDCMMKFRETVDIIIAKCTH